MKAEYKFKYPEADYIHKSTLKALGIGGINQDFRNSLRFTQDGYSDIQGEKVSQGLQNFWESLSPEERTAKAKKTVEKLKSFFKMNGTPEKILEQINENVWDFNNFLSKANTTTSNKAAETKRNLIENVFQPIINSMRIWDDKYLNTSKQYEEYLNEHPMEHRYNDWRFKKYNPIVIRHNEWLMFGMKDDSYIFYNVNNKKKYMCFEVECKDATPVEGNGLWKEITVGEKNMKVYYYSDDTNVENDKFWNYSDSGSPSIIVSK